ncbi:hypothetical protein ACWCOX_30625, partial [Micromonospora parva]
RLVAAHGDQTRGRQTTVLVLADAADADLPARLGPIEAELPGSTPARATVARRERCRAAGSQVVNWRTSSSRRKSVVRSVGIGPFYRTGGQAGTEIPTPPRVCPP